MTPFEVLTLLVSALAVTISAVSLYRTRTLAARQLELEEVNARLSQKQLEQLEELANARAKAQIDVQFIDKGSADYRLRLTNIGGVEARDVNLSYHGKGNLFIATEYAERFPIKTLRPSKFVELFVDPLDPSYRFEMYWTNPDGTIGKDDVQVHV